MNEQLLTIMIVASDPLIRAGLAGALEDHNITVLVQTDPQNISDGEVLLQSDVLLWDMGWDIADNQLDETLTIFREFADEETPLLVLLPDADNLSLFWETGVRGIALRNGDTSQIAAAIVAVASGLSVLDLTLRQELITETEAQGQPPIESLTRRELEVLHQIAEGLSNRAIAQHLTISEHTVKFHINAILSKLHAQSRTDAVVRAARAGLITL